MKNIIKIIFIISIATSVFLGCKEFVFELNSDNTGYILKEYKGSSESVIIPDTYKDLPVTEIGDHAFASARKTIKGNLIIPKNIKIIDEYAFSECLNLTSLTFHDNMKEIREGAFFRCRKLTGHLSIPKSLTKVDNTVFGITAYTSVSIPNNIKIIEANAFMGSDISGHLIIPDSVIEIKAGAFSGSNIEKFTFPKNIKRIDDGMFENCNKLQEVVIQEGITEIGRTAFRECTFLKSVLIPSTVTSIEELSFADCNRLINIICNAQKPPIINDMTFYNSLLESIKVPKDSVTAYQNVLPTLNLPF
jgi:hypothetical protein